MWPPRRGRARTLHVPAHEIRKLILRYAQTWDADQRGELWLRLNDVGVLRAKASNPTGQCAESKGLARGNLQVTRMRTRTGRPVARSAKPPGSLSEARVGLVQHVSQDGEMVASVASELADSASLADTAFSSAGSPMLPSMTCGGSLYCGRVR
jgi:hypothetical protein